MDIGTFLATVGIGSIIAVLIQRFFESRAAIRQRQYDERKEAYIGLLESWVKQENENFSDASYRDVGHWVLRAQLVSSPVVYNLLSAWMQLSPGSSQRIAVTDKLKDAMRDDLRSL